MKKHFRILIITIVSAVGLILPTYATTQAEQVAIIGNSLAAEFSFINKVDNTENIIYAGNHSCGGDNLDSVGLPTNDIEGYKAGDFADNIKSFTLDSCFYKMAIMFFGSNELSWDEDAFYEKYKNYIYKCKAMNPNIKLILCSVPYRRKDSGYYIANSKIDSFNDKIIKLVKTLNHLDLDYFYVNDYSLGDDGVHFSDSACIEMWQDLKYKYNIKG